MGKNGWIPESWAIACILIILIGVASYVIAWSWSWP